MQYIRELAVFLNYHRYFFKLIYIKKPSFILFFNNKNKIVDKSILLTKYCSVASYYFHSKSNCIIEVDLSQFNQK